MFTYIESIYRLKLDDRISNTVSKDGEGGEERKRAAAEKRERKRKGRGEEKEAFA